MKFILKILRYRYSFFLVFCLTQAGEGPIQNPKLCNDILKKILCYALIDPCLDLKKQVLIMRLVDTFFNNCINDIIFGRRNSDVSRQLIHRYLMVALERCVTYAIKNLDFSDIKKLKTYCFEKVRLPYTENKFCRLDVTEKEYKNFLQQCRDYLYTKAFSSYMTYYGKSFQEAKRIFKLRSYDLELYESIRFETQPLIGHVRCNIAYIPLVHPAFYKDTPQEKEVVIQITALDEGVVMNENCCLEQWKYFWQELSIRIESHCVEEITLSFWWFNLDFLQLDLCMKAIPEELVKKFKRLDITRCGITQLPDSANRLYNLEWLDCWGNLLTEIPKNIGNYKFLQRLELSRNKILKLEEDSFPELYNVLSFSCSKLLLDRVTMPLYKLPRLCYLNLSDGEFKKISFLLPQNMHGEKEHNHLYFLGLPSENLHKIPKNIGKMNRLEYIFLQKNRIESCLDTSIYQLPSLKRLYVPDKFIVTEEQEPLYNQLLDKYIIQNIN